MSDQLNALVQIISSSVQTLERAYAKSGTKYPSLDEPYKQSPLEDDHVVKTAAQLIVAAAAQLIASVRTPMEYISESANGMYGTTTLAFANDHNVADVLKKAGPQGLDATEIGKQIGVEGGYVARCLRYLSTRHIFREVKPNVFANNRLSSTLEKAKPLDEIYADMLTKYDAPVSAFVNLCTEETFMSSQYFIKFLKNPDGYTSPFNMAIKSQVNMFEWYQRPENQWRAHRFSTAMRAGADRFPPEYFSSAFDWNALPAGSIVIDVGGNIGSVTMAIARAAPKLRYIVHDLEAAIDEAKRHWEGQWPEAIADGAVRLEVHNFFEPMPIAADIYFLRSIIHDWPEAECRKILNSIRSAAKPTSKLILFDMVAINACQDTSTLSDRQKLPNVPYPLLANLGIAAGGFVTMADLQILSLLGGCERTVEEYEELGNATGWMLESVKLGPITAFIYATIPV